MATWKFKCQVFLTPNPDGEVQVMLMVPRGGNVNPWKCGTWPTSSGQFDESGRKHIWDQEQRGFRVSTSSH